MLRSGSGSCRSGGGGGGGGGGFRGRLRNQLVFSSTTFFTRSFRSPSPPRPHFPFLSPSPSFSPSFAATTSPSSLFSPLSSHFSSTSTFPSASSSTSPSELASRHQHGQRNQQQEQQSSSSSSEDGGEGNEGKGGGGGGGWGRWVLRGLVVGVGLSVWIHRGKEDYSLFFDWLLSHRYSSTSSSSSSSSPSSPFLTLFHKAGRLKEEYKLQLLRWFLLSSSSSSSSFVVNLLLQKALQKKLQQLSSLSESRRRKERQAEAEEGREEEESLLYDEVVDYLLLKGFSLDKERQNIFLNLHGAPLLFSLIRSHSHPRSSSSSQGSINSSSSKLLPSSAQVLSEVACFFVELVANDDDDDEATRGRGEVLKEVIGEFDISILGKVLTWIHHTPTTTTLPDWFVDINQHGYLKEEEEGGSTTRRRGGVGEEGRRWKRSSLPLLRRYLEISAREILETTKGSNSSSEKQRKKEKERAQDVGSAITLLSSFVTSNSLTITLLSQAIANLSATLSSSSSPSSLSSSDSSSIADEGVVLGGLLDTLEVLFAKANKEAEEAGGEGEERGLSLEVHVQVSRALANLSKGRWLKRRIALDWGEPLFRWLMMTTATPPVVSSSSSCSTAAAAEEGEEEEMKKMRRRQELMICRRNAVVGINNLVADENVAVLYLSSPSGLKTLSGLSFVLETATEEAEEQHQQQQQLNRYMCSLVSNLSKVAINENYHSIATHLFDSFAVEVFQTFLSTNNNNNNNTEDSRALKRYLSKALANFTKCSEIATSMVQPKRWNWVLGLAGRRGAEPQEQQVDGEVRRQLGRTVANVAAAVEDVQQMQRLPGIKELLEEWSRDPSGDLILHYEAVRALATMMMIGEEQDDSDVRTDDRQEKKGEEDHHHIKYADGVYLLHPSPFGIRSRTSNIDFDIVLLHGVTGNPFGTWVVGPSSHPTTNQKQINRATAPTNEDLAVAGAEAGGGKVWPRDWLSKDFPRSRIITVGYEMEISRWMGNALPIHERAKELLEKLKMASLGSRPIIFIAHSFGGLLIKEVLLQALQEEQQQQQGEEKHKQQLLLTNSPSTPSHHPEQQQNNNNRSLVDQTVGLVFYSTPHRGSQLIRLARRTLFFRGTAAVEDLNPDSETVQGINRAFASLLIQRGWPTLSFGEAEKTCVLATDPPAPSPPALTYPTKTPPSSSSSLLCFHVVDLESANPGYPKGIFLPVPGANHRAICKPTSPQDLRYSAVRDFISSSVSSQQRL